MEMPTRKNGQVADAASPAVSAPSPKERTSPPTLPFGTFKLAIERLKSADGLPQRIDRSAWPSRQFRAAGAHIVPAFRFLQMTDDEGRPREALFATIAAFGTEKWREQLRDILSIAYVDAFYLGMNKATPQEILHLFKRHYGMDAVSGRMAASFFIHATREARVDAVPLISASRKPSRIVEQITPEQFRAMMLAKLPPFDEDWSNELKLAWFTAFNELATGQE